MRFLYVLIAGMAVALGLTLLQGFSPPADADTLAYHFALPKQFLEAGTLEFVPRAVDGAVPLLVQMTYVPFLGLGGERALTLWAVVSTWGVVAVLFVYCRRYLDFRWSLAVALLFLTTPAVVFGGGSGQVEVRIALFVLVGAFAVSDAIRTGLVRYAVLAGVMAGLYMSSKYTGLLFAAACGVTILAQRRWLAHGAAFAAVALLVGSPWYVWNWINTGDPVFPVLFDLLGSPIWDTAHHYFFRQVMFGAERPVPNNILWFVAYPFAATFAWFPQWESGRTGLGLFVLLVLPFAVAGIWRFRRYLDTSPLWPVALIAFTFYAAWFFAGSPQRIRHLLPIYPLVLICVTVAGYRWAAATGNRRVLMMVVLAIGGLQLFGQGVFSLNYARHVFSGESRNAFLERNVSGYAPVPWINETLGPSDKVLLFARQLNYLIDVPIFYAHPFDARINVLPSADDPGLFFRQARKQGVTHLLVTPGEARPWNRLVVAGCAEAVRDFKTRVIVSRTLSNIGYAATEEGRARLIKLMGVSCP